MCFAKHYTDRELLIGRKARFVGFTVFAVIIVAAALLGLLFVKNGELSGLGRASKRGGLRAPHGRLVRTKRLDQIEEASFAARFGMLAAIAIGVSVVVGGLHLLGIINAGWFVSLHFALCMILCVGVSLSDSGPWRPLAYALVGYLLPSAVLAMLWAVEAPLIAGLSTQAFNLIAAFIGALTCAFALACLPASYSYAREFEDGHVNAIQVSSRSLARKAYDALEDAAWKPPADRIADYKAASDLRSFMEKR